MYRTLPEVKPQGLAFFPQPRLSFVLVRLVRRFVGEHIVPKQFKFHVAHFLPIVLMFLYVQLVEQR